MAIRRSDAHPARASDGTYPLHPSHALPVTVSIEAYGRAHRSTQWGRIRDLVRGSVGDGRGGEQRGREYEEELVGLCEGGGEVYERQGVDH